MSSGGGRKHKPIEPPSPEQIDSKTGKKTSVFQRLGGVSVSPVKPPLTKSPNPCVKFGRYGTCEYGTKCRYSHEANPENFPLHSSRHHDQLEIRSQQPDDTTVIVSTHVGSDHRRVAKVSKDHPHVKAMKADQNKSEAEVIQLEQQRQELQKRLSELGPTERSTTSTASESSSNGASGSGDESSSGSDSQSESNSSSGDNPRRHRENQMAPKQQETRPTVKSTAYPPVIREERPDGKLLPKDKEKPRRTDSDDGRGRAKKLISPAVAEQKPKHQPSVVEKVADKGRKRPFVASPVEKGYEDRAKRIKPHVEQTAHQFPDYKRQPNINRTAASSSVTVEKRHSERMQSNSPRRRDEIRGNAQRNRGDKIVSIPGKALPPERQERFDSAGYVERDWQQRSASDKRSLDDSFEKKLSSRNDAPPHGMPSSSSVRDIRGSRPDLAPLRNASSSAASVERGAKRRIQGEQPPLGHSPRSQPHMKPLKRSGGNAVPLRQPVQGERIRGRMPMPSPPEFQDKRVKDESRGSSARMAHSSRSRTPNRGFMEPPKPIESDGRNVEFRPSRAGGGQFRENPVERRGRQESLDFGKRTDQRVFNPQSQPRHDYRNARDYGTHPDRPYFNDFPREGSQDNLPLLMEPRLDGGRNKSKANRPDAGPFGDDSRNRPDRRRNEFERDPMIRGNSFDRPLKDTTVAKHFGRNFDGGPHKEMFRGDAVWNDPLATRQPLSRSRSPIVQRKDKIFDRPPQEKIADRRLPSSSLDRTEKRGIKEDRSRDSSRSNLGSNRITSDKKTSSSSKSSLKSNANDQKKSDSSGSSLLKSSTIDSRSSSEQLDSEKSLSKDTHSDASAEELTKETIPVAEKLLLDRRSKSIERSQTPIKDEKCESLTGDVVEQQPIVGPPVVQTQRKLESPVSKQKDRDSVRRNDRSRGTQRGEGNSTRGIVDAKRGRHQNESLLVQTESLKRRPDSKERIWARDNEGHSTDKQHTNTDDRRTRSKDSRTGAVPGRSWSRENTKKKSSNFDQTTSRRSPDRGRGGRNKEDQRSLSRDRSTRTGRRDSKGETSKHETPSKEKIVGPEEKSVTKIAAPGLSNDAELEPISDDELDNMGDVGMEENSKPKTISVAESLQVNWGSLLESSKLPTPVSEAVSRRSRYHPAAVLVSLGVSEKYAGPKLRAEVTDFINKSSAAGVALKSKPQPFCFLSGLGLLHASEMRNLRERETLFSNVGPFRQALSARTDLQIRRNLCKLSGKISDSAISSETGIPFNEELHKTSVELFMRKVEMQMTPSPLAIHEAAV